MEALEIARWQFGITTVYHFFFVPITIGLSFLVAGMQTAWFRTKNEKYLQLTRFFGRLFLINFAMGLVTGIVQEFQFGMNWSDYSRFVGDIFGAPLAIEGLLAFFLESTFLGLWIFGWDRLKPGLHLATIWLASTGTLLSAYFILAANSFMQNPVGYEFNAETARAELQNFAEVLTNQVVLVTFPHTISAAFMTAGAFVAGISMWHVMRKSNSMETRETFRTSMRLGAVVLIVSGAATIVTGDLQARVMTEVQPMKMAAAEALWEDTSNASFSVFTVGSTDGTEEVWSLRVPGLLSFMSTGSLDGEVRGINSLQAEYEQTYGAGDWTPNVAIAYWTFRIMMGLGFVAMAGGAWMLWATRKGRLPENKLLLWTAITLPFMPLLANSFGWIFTEMARQPWIVFGLMPTSLGVSPGVGPIYVLGSLIGFTLVYGLLAVVEVKLLLTYIAKGLPEAAPPEQFEEDKPLAFAY